jgi:hypothetical protein
MIAQGQQTQERLGQQVVEGACKHVVGLRFKRKSTRWTKQGARAVLHLRLDRLNSRWEKRCEHLRQQLPKAARPKQNGHTPFDGGCRGSGGRASYVSRGIIHVSAPL